MFLYCCLAVIACVVFIALWEEPVVKTKEGPVVKTKMTQEEAREKLDAVIKKLKEKHRDGH